MAEFCPGYPAPFDALVADYPGEDVYPSADFRVEWGPVFHRGRLDGSARVVVLGQDPATHEAISRRILVGEAGQRVQGLLAKLGVRRSYVMVNTFLYSVYGQGGGNRHDDDEKIAAYRNAWLDALLVGTGVTAVISLGQLAHTVPDEPTPATVYGTGWQDGDLVRIPTADLPPGSPDWWFDLAAWATRTGPDVQTKRATISVVVPRRARIWPVLPTPTPAHPEG